MTWHFPKLDHGFLTSPNCCLNPSAIKLANIIVVGVYPMWMQWKLSECLVVHLMAATMDRYISCHQCHGGCHGSWVMVEVLRVILSYSLPEFLRILLCGFPWLLSVCGWVASEANVRYVPLFLSFPFCFSLHVNSTCCLVLYPSFHDSKILLLRTWVHHWNTIFWCICVASHNFKTIDVRYEA